MSVVPVFNGIEDYLISKFAEFDFIVGVVPWLTSKRILSVLSKYPNKILMDSSNNFVKKNFQDCTQELYIYYGGRLMHNKYWIFFKEDQPVAVATGSYNPTESANNHRENLVFIQNPEVAQQYYQNFQELLGETERVI